MIVKNSKNVTSVFKGRENYTRKVCRRLDALPCSWQHVSHVTFVKSQRTQDVESMLV